MRRLLLPALAAFAAQAAGQASVPKSDWELEQERRDWKELEVTLPLPPKGELIEFFVSAASGFKFYIDSPSLSVGNDGVVRYTLVARSPSGARNVSYEGMRCERPGSYRVYAFGDGSGWSKSALSEWRPIERREVQRWHNELHRHYFCPNGALISSTAEGLDALRRGGHPSIAR